MKFKITDEKWQRILTEREVEIEFPFYYRLEDEEDYRDNRGAEMYANTETFGVVTQKELKECGTTFKRFSIWQISRIADGRKKFGESYKIEMESYAESSMITEDMIRGKITKEQYNSGVEEIHNEMLLLNK